jgi:hypothetical protein
MPNFVVTWTIDIEADTPEGAARKALAVQRDQNSIATVFEVHDGEQSKTVDLEEIDGEGMTHHPNCPANDGFGCRCADLTASGELPAA